MNSSLPDNVLSWLWSSLRSEYRDSQRAYSDVVKALSAYSSLSPRTDVYTYENGAPALLLVLQGTLPVSFRGNTYRFPIALWLPHAYPYEPPMTFVKPTPDMAVRPGQHVSAEGRVYHPYLAQWASNWNKSNLLDFFTILREVFAREPPVVARSQQPPIKSPPPNSTSIPTSPTRFGGRAEQQHNPLPHQIQAPPPPPKPPEIAGDGTQAAPAQLSASPAPPRPPKAGDGDSHNKISSPRNGYPPPGYAAPSGSPTTRRTAQDGPPPPPLPHEVEGSRPQPVSTQPYTQPTANQYLPPQHLPPNSQKTILQAEQQAFQGYQTQPGPAPRLPPQTQQGAPVRQQIYQQQHQPLPPQPKQPVPDLMSGPLEVTLPSQSSNADVPPPPIPRNPEKDALLQAISSSLLSQLSQTISQNASALPALQAQHEALQTAHSKMQAEMEQLHQLDAMLSDNEKILHKAMRDADVAMKSIGQREIPNVDEVLVAPTIVGEQLYGLIADERSLGDAMFALTRALDSGRVGADVFVKQTRSLAREQFLKKALIKKIAKGMGLAMDGD